MFDKIKLCSLIFYLTRNWLTCSFDCFEYMSEIGTLCAWALTKGFLTNHPDKPPPTTFFIGRDFAYNVLTFRHFLALEKIYILRLFMNRSSPPRVDIVLFGEVSTPL